MKNFIPFFSKFQKKRVIALVGRSGTGKSFRAKLIAQKYGIDYIIDDGILIYKKTILGGRSAKKEDFYLKAIKTAIFENSDHRRQITELIKERKINKILIIGTSEKMVKIICKRIKLPEPAQIIKIEDISSEEEIARAINSRMKEGKHVIPVPTLEVKRTYPNTLTESLQLFFKTKLRRSKKNRKNNKLIEKSVIRPDFTQKGAVTISESALAQMVYHCAEEFNEEYKIEKIKIKKENATSYSLALTLTTPLTESGLAVDLHEFQNYIVTSIEKYTGIMIKKVDIDINELK